MSVGMAGVETIVSMTKNGSAIKKTGLEAAPQFRNHERGDQQPGLAAAHGQQNLRADRTKMFHVKHLGATDGLRKYTFAARG